MLIHQSSQFQGQLRSFFNFNEFMAETSTKAPSSPLLMINDLDLSSKQAPSTTPSIIRGLDDDQEGVTAVDLDIVEGRATVEATTASVLGRRRRLKRKHLIQMARDRLELLSEEFFH